MTSVPPGQFVWLPLDTWIVVVGALNAVACALLGNFLVLRKMSLMGDAISHAVLPGLAIAFLITGSRDSAVMLAGAAVVGILTAVFTHWIHAVGKVDEGAAMGVVFTVLFALGLVLIRQVADHVDLDPDCVLYGDIVTATMHTVPVLGWDIPRAAVIGGAALLLNLFFVILLFKELRLVAFDPALATTLGIHATLMHYALMTLVAITTVAAFESVGSILVIAMLIVPAATARLLTDRMGSMVIWSAALGILAAGGGHVVAILGPAWVGYPNISTSSAGMMSVVAGLLFVGALLGAPRYGLISQALHRLALSVRIVREDLLGLLFRLEESGHQNAAAAAPAVLRSALGAGHLLTRLATWSLQRAGFAQAQKDGLRLTEAGRAAGRDLVRSHRLWETYLEKHLVIPPSHLHRPAEVLEHVTDAELQSRLAASVEDPPRDPHGTAIPRP